MPTNNGWIKLHRKILKNPIFVKPFLLQLFIYCVLKANHEPTTIIFAGKETEIKRGQFITGRFEMATETHQTPSGMYKRLHLLKKLGFLDIKSNNKFSLITVVNYELYQSEETKSNTRSNNKVTTKEQQSNTNKNDKNDKNEKKKILSGSPFLRMAEDYTQNEALKTALLDFIDMRLAVEKANKGKVFTERAFSRTLSTLDKLSDKDDVKINILNQSIINSWLGVFAIKNGKVIETADNPLKGAL